MVTIPTITLFNKTSILIMWEYIQPVFVLLFWIGFIRYVLLGKYTKEEISTYIKDKTMRVISIMGALLILSFFLWLLYFAFTSDYESDVCGFITSSDCN